jgi:hypothetical protein
MSMGTNLALGRASILSSKFAKFTAFSSRVVFALTQPSRGNSTALEEINKPPPKSLSDKWNDLPTGAKAGVYIGAAAAGSILLALFIFFFIRQRRKGRLEHALGENKFNNERNEMNNFQNNWKQSEWRHGGYQPVH